MSTTPWNCCCQGYQWLLTVTSWSSFDSTVFNLWSLPPSWSSFFIWLPGPLISSTHIITPSILEFFLHLAARTHDFTGFVPASQAQISQSSLLIPLFFLTSVGVLWTSFLCLSSLLSHLLIKAHDFKCEACTDDTSVYSSSPELCPELLTTRPSNSQLVVSFCIIYKVKCVQNQSVDFLSLNMLLLHFPLVNGVSKPSVAQICTFGVNPNSSFSFMP